MADWSCPDAELVLTVEAGKDRELWLAERRKGIGASDLAAIMGEPKYQTEFDVWLSKTGREPDRTPTIQMEMGTRLEDAVAQKFSEDRGLEIRRRGMLRSKSTSVLLANADRLVEDGYGLECKFVTQFTKMPTDVEYRGGWRSDWYWQGIGNLAVSGRQGWYLAVAIGNADFQIRSLDRDDPVVSEDITRVFEQVPNWWTHYVEGNEMPSMGAPPDMDEVLEGAKYEALIPEMLLEQRDRLREIRETRRDLKREEEEIKAKVLAEAGGAEWLLADHRPVLHLNPVKGRASFQKAALFAAAPVSGKDLVEFVGRSEASGPNEMASQVIAWAIENKLTEEQFTKRGLPSRSLLIVGSEEEDG